MKQFLILLFLIGALADGMQAQEDWTLFKKREYQNKETANNDTVKNLDYNIGDGNVTVNQSSEIDSLSSQIARDPFINGFTVQIEVSQQKAVIRDARYKFLKKYPDVPLDDNYNAPNTYLYAGRFYDRNSAYEFKHQIRDYFPDAIVIEKKMALPPLQGK